MTKAFIGFLDWCGRHSALLVAIAGFNLPISEDILKQSTQRFIESVNRLEPLVAKEFNHLNALYVKLNDEVNNDRMFKKLLRHSR